MAPVALSMGVPVQKKALQEKGWEKVVVEELMAHEQTLHSLAMRISSHLS